VRGRQTLPILGFAGSEVGLRDTQVLEKLKDTFLDGKLYTCGHHGTSLFQIWIGHKSGVSPIQV
jgi:hypothetical protein